ncbi:GH1 family beta-glucosidase [Thermostaphylospora chromogena]|mgnify:CR=1 FL=1|uniref:Beta-glucosidase n=1 Tax=Thermostaphylospora chromogena TaxID=35622 RepID=A0A1H1HW65_9ACTN|nr:GH1 family beta-glucosidase [Thermostaphylospora chromogena]SDR29316.1 broad-specificity cellobiase [Thermostaphylospora chromogena]
MTVTEQTGTAPRRDAFPPGFVWGTATAAYQIEGAAAEDGRGPSIWDAFCAIPGAVADGSSGEHACDHYHRWAEDLDLLVDLGVGAYRFSVAWPRVLPEGRGRVNRKGIDFYRRLVDGLRERGITPFLTLYHWDLPQALEELGGWRNRDTARWFADYTAVVDEALGEAVPYWITLNEPYCSSIVGYAEGRHAPGAREGHGALAAAHHLLLGHGLAVQRLRAAARPGRMIGVTLNMSPTVPGTDAPGDVAAARRMDLLVNRQFTEPLLGGRYAEDMEEVFGALTDFSFRREEDLDLISTPLDFLGVNYYYRIHAVEAPYREPDPARRTAFDIGVRTVEPPSARTSGLGWVVEPHGLYETLTGLRTRYPHLPPVYITENGYGDYGELEDTGRIAYIADHLAAVRDALAAGVDVRGYFCWSLIDNFEWARGYDARFGLVHVDYRTQTRTPKASYRWFRDYLRGAGAEG